MIFAGIDYSTSSPAICVWNTKDIKYSSINFLTPIKKHGIAFNSINLYGNRMPKFVSDEEKYDYIGSYFIDIIIKNNVDKVFIEDYSFGSTGMVFNIAENLGLLKHKLYKSNIPFKLYPPTTIKKYATGKGNADKNLMYDFFIKDTGIELTKHLCFDKVRIDSPISDIVDCYFIMKKGYVDEKT